VTEARRAVGVPIRVLYVTLRGDRPEAETFIGLARRGCRVRACCLADTPHRERFREAGIEVVPIPLKGRIDRESIRALRRELAAEPVDILHLVGNRAVSNGLLAVRAFPDVKVIAYRGIVGNVSFLSPMSWLRYLNPRIDRVICVADAIRRHFVEMRFLGMRLRPEKFVTIHKGHDLAWYTATPADLREHDIPDGAFVVGCVANMRPRKGIDVLVRALGQLPADAPIYLLLVGRMESAELDRLIAESPARERIRKLGFRRDAPAVIAACDAAVLPSIRREGLPKTVIEAMAYAVPPIVTDVGGSPELVDDRVHGLVVPPGDADALAAAILELYGDPALRAKLGAAARERIARDFTIDATIEKTLAVYRDVLTRCAPAKQET